MRFIQHYTSLRCVQEIYFSSVSNIDSAVAVLGIYQAPYNLCDVTAVSPEGRVSVSPAEVCAEKNEEVMFTCSVSEGMDNSFSWQEVSTGETVGSGELLSVTAVSTTQYQCTVENAIGSGYSTAKLLSGSGFS